MATQPSLESDTEKKETIQTEVTDDHETPAKVFFEEYLHYAKIQRSEEEQRHNATSASNGRFDFFNAMLKSKKDETETPAVPQSDMEKSHPSVSEQEYSQAQRAVRTATWISIFYLITTDILGPYSAPWAFAQVGFGSGAILFFVMGIIAFYTGILLWDMYLKLDSDKYPVQTYSDLAGIIFGNWAKHSINILQTVQLLFNVAVIVLSNAQGLAQVSKHHVCFSLLAVIWTLVGMGIGQIRSLQNYGGLAHSAIWMNLLVIFMTMGAVVHSAPNFDAAKTQNNVDSGPVKTSAFIQQAFSPQIVAVMQMVYSYGGAMLFIELMAEMRRPFDFWKGMVCAQLVIIIIYMGFGIFVYAFQGQFTINPANQGISTYGLQTATNVLSLVSALIAAGLYGNIGLKVIYANIVDGLFSGPAINSRRGRVFWVVMTLMYWALAFVIASAIPQLSNISGVVAALCILQFTYTFPPIMYVGFLVQRDATEGETEYSPGSSVSATRADSWSDFSRWWRGFSKRWWLNSFNIFLFLASAATAGLGAFSSIEGIIDAFKLPHSPTSFGCKAPV